MLRMRLGEYTLLSLLCRLLYKLLYQGTFCEVRAAALYVAMFRHMFAPQPHHVLAFIATIQAGLVRAPLHIAERKENNYDLA